MPSVDAAGEAPGPDRRSLLVGIVTIHLLWFDVTFAQRSQGVFGPTIDLPLGKTPAGLFVASPGGGRPEIDLVTSDPPGIDAYVVSERGRVEFRSTAPLRSRCRSWVVADMESNGVPALLGLTADTDTLVIARRRSPAVFDESYVPLECRPQHLLVADMENDRQKEILMFGKSMAGIQVLKRRPNGSYTPGPLLLPDVSASAVAVTDLNGDGIPDIFVANWLSNQVALFFGIARNVFSEQVTIELEGEPGGISITPVSKRRTLLLAVVLPEAKTIAVFSGNGAGEFRRNATVVCPSTPQHAEFVNLNGDAWPDLVVSSDRGLQTVLARSATDFEPAMVYGVGNTLDLWQIADVNGDHQGELVCADRRGRRLLIASRGLHGSRTQWPTTYLAGERPQGMTLADVDGDGTRDILVANQGSSSISCFLNKGDGTFSPQVTIATAENPSTVRMVDGEVRRFLVAHRGEGKLSVISTAVWNAPAVFSIPTASDPVVLRAVHRTREEPLRVLVRSRGGAQQSATFSLFEQLTGKTFLEKTFTTVLPTAFRGIATASITDTSGTDLVFLTANRSAKNYTLSCASAGADFDYRKVWTLLAFTDSVSSFRGVQTADVDGDGFEDILVVGNNPGKGIGVIFAQAGGTFDPAIHWIDGFLTPPAGTILVEDLDGDGIRDCLAIDLSSQTLRVAYGAGGRQFSPPRVITAAAGVNSFVVGSLLNPRSVDLALSNEERGTISILYHPFSR